MTKNRLEAFSDGVIAILITIMVLELQVPPHSADLNALRPLLPIFLSYILSFVYLGIYWNNHHHMLHAAEVISGGVLWANLHLLFWLSLVPFVTAWMGENHFAAGPTVLYGVVLFMAGTAYWILERLLISKQEKDSVLTVAIGKRDLKANISPVIYIIAIIFAFFNQWIAGSLYVVVALIWLIPDKRIEREMFKREGRNNK